MSATLETPYLSQPVPPLGAGGSGVSAATDVPGLVAAPASEEAARIDLAPYDVDAALELERQLGVSHVLAQVLVRRGYGDPAAARAFLHPSVRHDPSLFSGIDRATAMIARHVAGGSRIVVHGDYDVDGVCATAVLVRALRSLGADPHWYLPSRTEDGYGLSEATVERLAAGGTALIVTVDCGITAVDQIATARSLGVDVVVSDHHRPRADGLLPDCPIVHPALSGYPCADLCGTAVAHKLAEALGATTLDEDLELVALATVADLVPLRGENRRIVRDGIRALAGTARPGLRALMAVSQTDPSGLDASALGFRLAPRINAAGRMRRADAGLELLLCEDEDRSRAIARELDQVNAERRAVEQQITWEAEAQAKAAGDVPIYVLAGAGWHPGVVGIVASRIVERFHRPAVLIALDADDPAATAGGSGRSIPGFDLLAALQAADEHLLAYGGHRAAAGVTIAPASIDAFRAAVCAHASATLTAEMLVRRERVDAVVSGTELGLLLAEELEQVEPCGIGNPAPNLLVPGARIDGVRPMSDGRHARFSVISGGARAAAVAFGCDGHVPGGSGGSVDASFRLERNVWRGRVEPRLVLRAARPLEPAPIAIVGEPDDYLAAALAECDRGLSDEVEADAGITGVVGVTSVPGVTGVTGVSGVTSVPGVISGPGDSGGRDVIDRRGHSPLSVIADAVSAAPGQVLAVCTDVPRRLHGLTSRTGGFTLVSHASLAADPGIANSFAELVVLDPPCSAAADAAIRRGAGHTLLAWGAPELRFSEQMHEQEFALRTSLVALYRAIRHRGRASGEELEHLLRGDGPHARSARLAGRLIRVLTELELVSLDRGTPALVLADARQTELERSTAYQAYVQAYEIGLQFLTRATAPLNV